MGRKRDSTRRNKTRPLARVPFVTITVYDVPPRIRGETRKEWSWLDLSYYRHGEKIEQSIPGLMYADDIVLMADNRMDLQKTNEYLWCRGK